MFIGWADVEPEAVAEGETTEPLAGEGDEGFGMTLAALVVDIRLGIPVKLGCEDRCEGVPIPMPPPAILVAIVIGLDCVGAIFDVPPVFVPIPTLPTPALI
jgi:hypothetical protein